MTDARYPERWLVDRRVNRLSDKAHRAFVVTLAYSVANRTDGVLTANDLDDLPAYVAHQAVELVTAGLWQPLADGTGWQVIDYLDTQSSRKELEAGDRARVAAREKKAAQRAAGQDKPTPPQKEPSPVVPRDVPGDHTGKASASARQGKDTPGFEQSGEHLTATDPWAAHPVAVPGHGAVQERQQLERKQCGFCHGWFVPERPSQAAHKVCPEVAAA